MKRIILNLSFALIFLQGFCQGDTTLIVRDTSWRLKSIYGLNGTQSSFVNWNAGGRNNIAALAFISASANYKKGEVKWDNNLELALGGLQYTDRDSKESLQKTDDRIDIGSNFGYKLKEYYYLSILGGFRTQFLDGFSFPNDSVRVSTFMAPGYVNLALGIDYSPNPDFGLFVSPLAMKMTFVRDGTLADAGAFGVRGATYDELGNVVTPGKMFRGEFGSYLRITYNKNIAKNINLKSRLELFSNYIENPQNVDVNAEMLWSFKVNSWCQASLSWMFIYDDDIDVADSKGNIGPRGQFKSVLGLGITYILKNFEEKE